MNTLNQAQGHFNSAEYFFTQTYPVIKDPKMLLGIITNLGKAIEAALDVFLKEEGLHPQHHDFASKIRVLEKSTQVTPLVRIMKEIYGVHIKHKESPMAFRRQDSFIICTDDYNMTKLDEAKVKEYIFHTQQFLRDISSLIYRKA